MSRKKQPNALRPNDRKPIQLHYLLCNSLYRYRLFISSKVSLIIPLDLSVKQGIPQTELNILPFSTRFTFGIPFMISHTFTSGLPLPIKVTAPSSFFILTFLTRAPCPARRFCLLSLERS